MQRRWGWLIGLGIGAVACSPTLDWREWRPADSGLTLLLPCKPTPQMRTVSLAGQPVRLALHACSAGGQTWAVAIADTGDPARVGPALQALQDSAVANLQARGAQPQPLAVKGATPNAAAQRLALTGRLPDGQEVQEQTAVFAQGTRVFQATVVGASLPSEGVDTFFGGLKFVP